MIDIPIGKAIVPVESDELSKKKQRGMKPKNQCTYKLRRDKVKKYRVLLGYTAYQEYVVEAESEDKAVDEAEKLAPVGFVEAERWSDADMVEEVHEEPVKEPAEGDFILSPCGVLGRETMVSIVGGSSATFRGEEHDEEAKAYIMDRMRRDNFYPTVWMESDHGNREAIKIFENT